MVRSPNDQFERLESKLCQCEGDRVEILQLEILLKSVFSLAEGHTVSVQSQAEKASGIGAGR